MKFGTPMHNHMPMTVKSSDWKPEVEFQYGGRLFSEAGSSNISAANWGIFLKFGVQITFDLTKPATGSSILRCSCHLGKSIGRHNSVTDRPVGTNFGVPRQNSMPMTTQGSKSKPEIEFQHSGPLFLETGNSSNKVKSVVDWGILPKFGLRIDFDPFKWVSSPNPKTEVKFRRRVCGRVTEAQKLRKFLHCNYTWKRK